MVAKVTSYGSFVHFRQDHERIRSWTELLAGSRFRHFLARVIERDGRPCLHRDGPSWVAFYEEVERGEALPRILSEREIENLAEEIRALPLAPACAWRAASTPPGRRSAPTRAAARPARSEGLV